jgi:chromosome segregation ATPase
MSIADGVLDCAKSFRKLQANLAERCAQLDEGREANQTMSTKLNDSFERFQLWSSNLGAHRRDKSSLDQRLWEASHLQCQVLEYLKDLQQGLADGEPMESFCRSPVTN